MKIGLFNSDNKVIKRCINEDHSVMINLLLLFSIDFINDINKIDT